MARPLWRHDAVVFVVGVLSIAIVFWFESTSPNAQQTRIILAVDAAMVAYFFADFIAMWRDRNWDRKWFGWNAWRLLGMIPLAVAHLGFLRLLRLARIVAVLDSIPPVHQGLRKLRRNIDWVTLRPLALTATFITVVGAVLVWLAERRFNPELMEFTEAIWWAIVTVTTVGYGDVTPITPLGRMVAVVLMVTGIGTIGMLASQVSSAMIAGHATGQSVDDRLARLVQMHTDGHLSDSEFEAAKARILE